MGAGCSSRVTGLHHFGGRNLHWSCAIRTSSARLFGTVAAIALGFANLALAQAQEAPAASEGVQRVAMDEVAQPGEGSVAEAPALPIDELPADQAISDTVIDLAGWVIANDDHQDRPFTIVDKKAAQIFVFGSNGKLMGAAPVLIGSAVGDHSAPGVADRELRDIPMEDRTTPAGRFVAGYGPAAGGKRALWIEWETAISIHAVTTGVPAEERPLRLASPSPDDNRISHGCLNVSQQFYDYVLSPAYARGGMFYILPDEMAIEEAIPGFSPNSGA